MVYEKRKIKERVKERKENMIISERRRGSAPRAFPLPIITCSWGLISKARSKRETV